MAIASMDEILPAWSDRELLTRFVEHERPHRFSLRAMIAIVGTVIAAALFGLAGFAAAAYVAQNQRCADAAQRYPDARAYCMATPSLSSSGYDPVAECERYARETTLDVCTRHNTASLRTAFQTATLGVIVLVFSALFGAWWWFARRALPAFVDLLTRRPRDVCWVYLKTTTYVRRYDDKYGRTSSVLMLCTASRHAFTIGPVTVDDGARLLKVVAPIVPWATFGHTEANAAAYGRDPRSLFRA
ncbi:MAG: hypothetical protein U0234_32040 [Sandaracinus sp.]